MAAATPATLICIGDLHGQLIKTQQARAAWLHALACTRTRKL
jgi:hypothetical protein